MSAGQFQLPVSLGKLTWVLVSGEWIEVKQGTATYRRDASDDLTGWIDFEDAHDFTGERTHCLVAAIVAYRAEP